MSEGLIRRCGEADFEAVWAIVNDGARAYRGVVPADCLHDPYMSREELAAEMAAGVEFWGYESGGKESGAELAGVMGLQQVRDVTLIRHAYVRSDRQGEGIGSKLLAHLRLLATKPMLVGTWADATWAIRFYERHGFALVSFAEKEELLRRYWTIGVRQIETSVVLAERDRRP
jgi:GNAT superfamily N-acetyltransferase